jgi:hypothetical protein
VSGKNLILHVPRPVQPPQLLMELAPLTATFQSFSGVRTDVDGVRLGPLDAVQIRFVIAVRFHIYLNG